MIDRATRYYIDTEFIERPGLLQMISIGLACEDWRGFYAVSSEFDPGLADPWVHENVLIKLGAVPRETHAEIRYRLLAFIGDTRPEFWGYFADYDWVCFCWLMGRMVDLPKSWPKFCLDVRQEMNRYGVRKSDLPAIDKTVAHNALEDARWTMAAHAMVEKAARQ